MSQCLDLHKDSFKYILDTGRTENKITEYKKKVRQVRDRVDAMEPFVTETVASGTRNQTIKVTSSY